MAQENFSVLRTFKASLGGSIFKVEQLKGDRDRQDIRYRVFTEIPEVGAFVFRHNAYWKLNPVEVKG